MMKFYLLILIQGTGNLIIYHEYNLLAKLTLNELVLTLWDQGNIFSVPLVYNKKHATRFTSCFTFFVNMVIGREQKIQPQHIMWCIISHDCISSSLAPPMAICITVHFLLF